MTTCSSDWRLWLVRPLSPRRRIRRPRHPPRRPPRAAVRNQAPRACAATRRAPTERGGEHRSLARGAGVRQRQSRDRDRSRGPAVTARPSADAEEQGASARADVGHRQLAVRWTLSGRQPRATARSRAPIPVSPGLLPGDGATSTSITTRTTGATARYYDPYTTAAFHLGYLGPTPRGAGHQRSTAIPMGTIRIWRGVLSGVRVRHRLGQAEGASRATPRCIVDGYYAGTGRRFRRYAFRRCASTAAATASRFEARIRDAAVRRARSAWSDDHVRGEMSL